MEFAKLVKTLHHLLFYNIEIDNKSVDDNYFALLQPSNLNKIKVNSSWIHVNIFFHFNLLDRHTLTHLTGSGLDHTHDHSQPGAGGAVIPITGQTGHQDHHHEGPGGDHDHQQVWNQQGGGPGRQVTDFFEGGSRTTPGVFGSQFGTQQNGGVNDIHARIASEFRQSNIPDSQLGVDLSSILFQDPVTGQGVNISPWTKSIFQYVNEIDYSPFNALNMMQEEENNQAQTG